MDSKSLITELMKQEGIITPLEQDILDTWTELLKHPLDMSSANQKIVSNNLKYPDIYTKVSVLPSTVQKPVQEITEIDLRYILDWHRHGPVPPGHHRVGECCCE